MFTCLCFSDTVSTRDVTYVHLSVSVTPCLQEMSLMLTCLQKHDFSEVKCSKEVEQFLHCNASFTVSLIVK